MRSTITCPTWEAMDVKREDQIHTRVITSSLSFLAHVPVMSCRLEVMWHVYCAFEFELSDPACHLSNRLPLRRPPCYCCLLRFGLGFRRAIQRERALTAGCQRGRVWG